MEGDVYIGLLIGLWLLVVSLWATRKDIQAECARQCARDDELVTLPVVTVGEHFLVGLRQATKFGIYLVLA